MHVYSLSLFEKGLNLLLFPIEKPFRADNFETAAAMLHCNIIPIYRNSYSIVHTERKNSKRKTEKCVEKCGKPKRGRSFGSKRINQQSVREAFLVRGIVKCRADQGRPRITQTRRLLFWLFLWSERRHVPVGKLVSWITDSAVKKREELNNYQQKWAEERAH
jgi:hypothetical protein